MIVVIFRATLRRLDDPTEYIETACRLRELALNAFGCVAFQAVTEGDQEVALSWWPDEAALRAWQAHPEHREAQARGRDAWYVTYDVQVATVARSYSWTK